MSDETRTTRRKMLAASGSVAVLGLAGCVGDDDDTDDAGTTDDHDDHDHDDHDHDDHDHDHMAIGEFEILDRGHDEEVAAYVHGDHWHGGPLEVPLGDNLSLGAYIEDEDGHTIELDGEFELRAELDEGAPDVVDFDFHGDHIHVIGEEEGLTDIVFHLWHGDHADYTTPPLTVQVSEDGHDHDDHNHDHLDVEEFSVLDRAHDPHEEVAYVHGDHWHGELPEVPLDDNISLGASVEDDHGDEIVLGTDLELRVRLADGAPEIVEFDYHGDHVHIIGEEEGLTEVVFQLWHDDHADYETPPITAVVGDADHDHDDHDHDDHGHDDHDDH